MSRAAIVLVTGVGHGFGRAVALAWGRAGCDVVCADRDVGLASKTAAEIEEAGGQAIPLQIDVTVGMDVRHAFDKVDELFGRLGGVVHVAARSSGADPLRMTDNEFSELVDDTLRSSQLVLRTASRVLTHGFAVIIAPPSSASAPQNGMIREGLRGLVSGYAQRSPSLRVNLVVPSRNASDPKHDARLVNAVLYLGGAGAEGIHGTTLEVELPPPPRVVERLLPEIQAALDDRVRQDDLEADSWRGTPATFSPEDPFEYGTDDDDELDDVLDDDDDPEDDDEEVDDDRRRDEESDGRYPYGRRPW